MVSSCRTVSADRHARAVGVLYLVLSALLWSTVPVGTRLLVRDGEGAFSVTFLSAMRFWVAVLVFALLRLRHARHDHVPFRVSVRGTGWLLLAGLGLFGNYLLYGIGLRFTTAGATSLISQTHTVLTVLLAAWLLGECLTLRKVLGMTVTLGGVLLVIFRGASLHDLLAPMHLWGNLIQVAAAVAWPLYAIGQTKLVEERHDQDVLLPIFTLAALFTTIMLPFSGPALHHPTLADWGVLLFLGVGSTALAYWLYAAGVQRLETSEGAMFSVLAPLVAPLLAWWLLAEPLQGNLLAGMTLVVAGLVLIVYRRAAVAYRRPVKVTRVKAGV
jgi:drug/metabolite transporter (DMT)-like permease